MGTYLLLDETQAVFDTREAGGEKTATCNLNGQTIILSFDEETGTYYNSDVGLTGLSENGDWYIALGLEYLPGKAVVTNQTETVYDPDGEYEFTGTVINILTKPIVSFECELGTFTYDREVVQEGYPYYVYKNGTKELILENRLPNNKPMVAFDPDPNGDGWWGDDFTQYSITSYELTENEIEMFAGWGDYNSEDNLYYLYTGPSASEAYRTGSSCVFLVPKITVATSPWVVSVKPGVAYVKENKRVYYNKENGIFSKFIYTVTSTTNPTFIVASLQDISYIIIDGRKISRSELIGGERFGTSCGYYYQFDTDGMHSVEIKFKRGDLRSRYLFGKYSNDFCFDHAPVVSAQLGEGITTIPYGCFASVEELEEVKLPSTLETIGPWAFAYTRNLYSIAIPDSVKRIEDGAFAYNSYSTRTLELTGGDGVEYIGDDAFQNSQPDGGSLKPSGNILYLGKCAYKALNKLPEGETGYTLKNDTTCIYVDCFSGHTDITSITIPNTVKSIGMGAFQGCTNLGEITVPDSVEGILGYGNTYYTYDGVFANCTSLTSVTLGTGITGLCSYCFYGCSNLKSITIPANVVSLGTSLFEGCTQLENVSFGSNTEAIPAYCFRNCASITSVTIPNTVTSFGSGCFMSSGLQEITIPSSVKTINSSMFSVCTGLTSVTIPDSVTSLDLHYMFSGCTNLVEVTLPLNAKGTSNYGHIETSYAFALCDKLTGVTLPYAVSAIGEYCFVRCTSLPASITIADHVKCFRYCAFSGCSQITAVTVETDELKNYSGHLSITSFAYCSSLSEFYGPCASQDHKLLLSGSTVWLAAPANFPATYTIPSNVQALGESSLRYANGLTNLTIPGNVTGIGQYCFYQKTSLTSVTLSEGLKDIGMAAFNNTRISTLTIPNSVTTLGNSAFTNSYNLNLVNIGTGLTSLPNHCFSNSFNLVYSTVNIPGNIKSIGTLCFGYTTTSNANLRTVNIENGLETVGASAFCRCRSIEQLTLPASLKSISNGCFSGCSSLATIRCEATTAPTVYANTFRYIKTGGTLYYPAGSDYSSWMSNSNYYLGSRSWTSQTFTP